MAGISAGLTAKSISGLRNTGMISCCPLDLTSSYHGHLTSVRSSDRGCDHESRLNEAQGDLRQVASQPFFFLALGQTRQKVLPF